MICFQKPAAAECVVKLEQTPGPAGGAAEPEEPPRPVGKKRSCSPDLQSESGGEMSSSATSHAWFHHSVHQPAALDDDNSNNETITTAALFVVHFLKHSQQSSTKQRGHRHFTPVHLQQQCCVHCLLMVNVPFFAGTEFVRPVVGYFCNLCQVIYADEDEAKLRHCSSLTHYRKYQVTAGGLRRSTWCLFKVSKC